MFGDMLGRMCNCPYGAVYRVDLLTNEVTSMKLYSYDGPVLEFNRIIANHWKASTRAPSEKKARCNLAHQFKQEYDRVPQSKITIPGKLTVVEGKDSNNE